MHATHPDWLHSEPNTAQRRGAAGDGLAPPPTGAVAAEGLGASRLGGGRARLLVGLYVAMWLAVIACCASHFLRFEAEPAAIPGSGLFLGLIGGQVGSCLLWGARGRLGQMCQHALAWSATGLSAGLLCHWLGGSFEHWWLGMVILALGAKAADWAMRQPLLGQAAAAPQRPGTFSLATWISFSLWVAVLLRLLPGVTQQPTETALIVAVWGGLSLWVAVHRFAFRQLFTPSDPYWQRQRNPRTGRAVDAVGILLILSLFHALLGAGLWHFYAGHPLGFWLALACGTAAMWQAIDVQFEALVEANSDNHIVTSRSRASGQVAVGAKLTAADDRSTH